jgi:hypothetical protein
MRRRDSKQRRLGRLKLGLAHACDLQSQGLGPAVVLSESLAAKRAARFDDKLSCPFPPPLSSNRTCAVPEARLHAPVTSAGNLAHPRSALFGVCVVKGKRPPPTLSHAAARSQQMIVRRAGTQCTGGGTRACVCFCGRAGGGGGRVGEPEGVAGIERRSAMRWYRRRPGPGAGPPGSGRPEPMRSGSGRSVHQWPEWPGEFRWRNLSQSKSIRVDQDQNLIGS